MNCRFSGLGLVLGVWVSVGLEAQKVPGFGLGGLGPGHGIARILQLPKSQDTHYLKCNPVAHCLRKWSPRVLRT